jgi:hypothetical protein
MSPEISDEALLTRNATAAALTETGFPTSPATLATKATRGGGPPFRRFGARPLYAWGDALRWAQSRLGPLISSTSEAGSLPAAAKAKIAAPAGLPRSRRGNGPPKPQG